jgi:malic enzyme
VSTPAEQEARVYDGYLHAGDDVQRYLFLTALQDRNETLFYRLLLSHIEEMVPVVYTPTVGRACELYSHIYRRPRGIYLSPRDRGRIAEILRRAPVDDCRIIVVTDNEAILGLGDLGVGGMGIPIGKLALYTAAAGIHPASCLPIDVDVGTDNLHLRHDPLYLGVRQPRLRGEPYFALIDELVEAVKAVFPRALVQWEDFANDNAFHILERHRDRILSFDDDIQGTGAVVVAGLHAALHQAGRELADERVVFYGVGAAGGGCARAVRQALRDAGVAESELSRRVLCVDSHGLIVAGREGLFGHKQELAAEPAMVADWPIEKRDRIGLLDVVRSFRPNALVGLSGQPGAFDEAVVRAMHAECARPVVMPLSNPTAKAEATPADVLRWTQGAALVATGSPFPPVEYGGQTHVIGQANNVLVFPGVGLGAVAVEARRLPDEAFLAAAKALFEASEPTATPGAPLFPPLRALRQVSHAVAVAVGKCLVRAGAAPPLEDAEVEARVASLVWEPVYHPYRPAD